MSPSWHVVRHTSTELPTLAIRVDVTESEYSIYLTDLEHIWAETLNRDELIERAHGLGCSIDPEDQKQYDIFTSKLHKAVLQQDGTTLEVKSARSGTSMTLSLTTKLPAPLAALEWEAHLQRKDVGLVKSCLLGPLLEQAGILQRQVDTLINEMHAKDHVLEKITDKLFDSGVSLTDVFPNMTGIGMGTRLKPASREKLGQHIRGLAPFSHESWSKQRASLITSESAHETISKVLPNVLAKTSAQWILKPHWWSGLDVTITGAAELNEEDYDKEKSMLTSANHKSPRAVESENNSKQLQDENSTTDDDFDNDKIRDDLSQEESSRESLEPSILPSTTIKQKKLGTIGGRKLEHPNTPPADNSEHSPTSPKRKLGTIGGKTDAVKMVDGDTTPKDMPARGKKLGAIGGRSLSSNTSPQAKTEHINTTKPDATSSTTEISATEQAERRREEIKRQLESKHVPPTKKKRRF